MAKNKTNKQQQQKTKTKEPKTPAFCHLCTCMLEMLDTFMTTHNLHRWYRCIEKDFPKICSHVYLVSLYPNIHFLL